MTFDFNPNMSRIQVHNLEEVKAICKEAFARGEENTIDGTRWYTHQGAFICKSKIREHTDLELELADMSSLIISIDD